MKADASGGAKSGIRQAMRVRRRTLSAAEKSVAAAEVARRILSDERIAAAFARAGAAATVAVYLASVDEIDLTAAIVALLARGVTVVAPRWNGATYELAKLRGLADSDLRRGPMGILEPSAADLVRPAEVSVWLVPGLAFTRAGGRLGYGGGWYDRLLADANSAALKLGVAYAFQVVEKLPQEPHDILLDGLVTAPPECA